MGFRTIWHCEADKYASAVLRKHWPEEENLGDITKVDWRTVKRPDILCGGFPCQDISIAGKRAGIKEGTRSGLWSYFHEAIRVLRPSIIIIENVSEITNNGLSRVLADLAKEGYDAEWFNIRALDFGALHRRERIFIIAYSNKRFSNGENQEIQTRGNTPNSCFVTYDWKERIQRFRKSQIQRQQGFSWCKDVRRIEDLQGRSDIPKPLICGKGHGIPNRVDRTACLGNAVVPEITQFIGELILEHFT